MLHLNLLRNHSYLATRVRKVVVKRTKLIHRHASVVGGVQFSGGREGRIVCPNEAMSIVHYIRIYLLKLTIKHWVAHFCIVVQFRHGDSDVMQ